MFGSGFLPVSPGPCVLARRVVCPQALRSRSATFSYALLRPDVPVLLPSSHYAWRLVAGSLPFGPPYGWSSGPSRRYLCASFPACLDPYPGSSCGARARYFPPDSGLPPVRTRSALRHVPCSDFSTDPLSGLQSFLDVQARRFARHPGRSYRYGHVRMAAVTFPSEPLVVRCLPTPRICYPSESGH